MRIRDIFCVIYVIYGIPFMTTPFSGGGIFDFLWTDWGWNVDYYCYGLLTLTPIASVIMIYDWWKNRKSLGKANEK